MAVLGFSHVDFNMALLWLKWAAFLDSKAKHGYPLVVVGTRRVKPEQWALMKEAVSGVFGIRVHFAVCRDENESGYPRSANHLFVRSLEICNERHPGSSVLWIETDCVPVKPDWFAAVEAEHFSHNQPFMGVHVDGVIPHMAGCGVYPPDWKAQAPMLLTSLGAPDVAEWGRGKGQPWDTWAGSEVVPKMYHAKTIQQIWRPGTFTDHTLKRLLPDTVLFHQCKNGSLIAALCHTTYPEFSSMKPSVDSAFMILSARSEVTVLDTVIKFIPCARGPGGGVFCVFRPKTAMEESLLNSIEGAQGVSRISIADYDSMIGQSKRLAV